MSEIISAVVIMYLQYLAFTYISTIVFLASTYYFAEIIACLDKERNIILVVKRPDLQPLVAKDYP